jgi:hypothetical protein
MLKFYGKVDCKNREILGQLSVKFRSPIHFYVAVWYKVFCWRYEDSDFAFVMN